MLTLCKSHKQESNQSEFAEYNCDHCKLLKLLDNHDWYCGCGHWNGANLSNCSMCNRTPRGE